MALISNISSLSLTQNVKLEALMILIVIITLPFLLKALGIIGAGLNLILFESVSIATGIIITTKIIKASSFTFWVRDRLLMLFVSAAIFSAFIPFRGLLTQGPWGRASMAAYLCSVFLIGTSLYVLVMKNSNFIDQDTKNRIANLFKMKT